MNITGFLRRDFGFRRTTESTSTFPEKEDNKLLGSELPFEARGFSLKSHSPTL